MFWEFVNEDSYRVTGRKLSFPVFLKAYRNQGFRFIFFQRIAFFYKKNIFLSLISKVMMRHYCYKFGFQIPASTRIGKGVFFSHFGTVVINDAAVIGNYCNLNHNITIGKQNRGEKKGVPTIGNLVWIGTGSVIVGNIKIGDNVLIAPNSYVNFDVPAESVVYGNPGMIKEKKNATQFYINNIPTTK